MKILILDNYDSFTYNLLHLVKELGYNEVDVIRNDQISLDEVEKYDKIILSSGPGIPSESGLLLPLIRQYGRSKSILGVCLGHLAIAKAYGATLINLDEVYHGIATDVRVIDRDVLFEGVPKIFPAGCYHSWSVSNIQLPNCLQVTAVDSEGQIMTLKHKAHNVHGVQFHPESILTPDGKTIVKNFLKS
jgi:anthranilate synthase component 2